jgi:hypothetical protein
MEAEAPAVGHLPVAAAPAPSRAVPAPTPRPTEAAPEGGWLKRMWSTLFGTKTVEEAPAVATASNKSDKLRDHEDGRRNRRERRERQPRNLVAEHSNAPVDQASVELNKAETSNETFATNDNSQRGRRRERNGRRERAPRQENTDNLSIDQIADNAQAEIQAMSRAALERLNAKAETIEPTEAPAVFENPRRTARAERMSRADRWERQITIDPMLDPALLAAQDAAADSLMGNRSQSRQSTLTEATQTSLTFIVSTEQIGATEVKATDDVEPSAAVVKTPVIREITFYPDGSQEMTYAEDDESSPKQRQHDDRRGRRSPYRRRMGRRPSSARRDHNQEQVAAGLAAPQFEHTPNA